MLNLKQVRQAIENKQAFKTNNIEAFYGEKGYTIYSYYTCIYNDSIGLDNTKYSHTTSKLQNMIRQAFNLEVSKV